MYVHCIEMYIYSTHSRYILYKSVWPLAVLIHFIGWGSQSPNLPEIHSFKWEFLFHLQDVSQERHSGMKQDLLVLTSPFIEIWHHVTTSIITLFKKPSTIHTTRIFISSTVRNWNLFTLHYDIITYMWRGQTLRL